MNNVNEKIDMNNDINERLTIISEYLRSPTLFLTDTDAEKLRNLINNIKKDLKKH